MACAAEKRECEGINARRSNQHHAYPDRNRHLRPFTAHARLPESCVVVTDHRDSFRAYPPRAGAAALHLLSHVGSYTFVHSHFLAECRARLLCRQHCLRTGSGMNTEWCAYAAPHTRVLTRMPFCLLVDHQPAAAQGCSAARREGWALSLDPPRNIRGRDAPAKE
jgi:hypothetical protein